MSTPTVRQTLSWRGPVTALVCVAVAVLATSCTPSIAQPAATPTPPPPVGTPGPDIDLEAEERLALTAWEKGVGETDQIIAEKDYSNAETRLSPYFEAESLTGTLELLKVFEAQKVKVEGEARSVAVADSAVTPGEKRMTLSAFMCIDLRDTVTTVDGNPVPSPKPFQVDNAKLARDFDGDWKVTESESTQLEDLSSSRCAEVLH